MKYIYIYIHFHSTHHVFYTQKNTPSISIEFLLNSKQAFFREITIVKAKKPFPYRDKSFHFNSTQFKNFHSTKHFGSCSPGIIVLHGFKGLYSHMSTSQYIPRNKGWGIPYEVL